ncbi:MAG: DegT/DnrJ/EryC1/StrS family aminotransferase [Lachnospiraceae bacterium]|nr:DegT/DnrJ/EryC1/StrS family aminotransferase [Lachnospiraceae bacterium]
MDGTLDFIPVNEPLLDGNEKKYLEECVETGWISSEGSFVRKFEDKMSSYVDRKHGVSVTNGTAALEIAVRAIGIEEGDEVIMPTLTIISCANAVIKAGAKPVFVDCDINTFNMIPSDIEKKITLKTKAIMIVHLYGLPVLVDEIMKIANKYNLKVIEDAAEMHGQTYFGRPCGSFGDVSIFSFYPNKIITTGEGGMIVSDDDEIAERCRELRNLSFKKDNRYIHDEISGNCRFTNLQAAVGLAQLERIDEHIKKKRYIGKYYTEKLNGIKGLTLPIEKTDYAENIYWVYSLVIDEDVELDNRKIQKILSNRGIGTRTFFWCMHEQPVLKRMEIADDDKYANAEFLARKGFYIPSGLAVTNEQMNRVSDVLWSIMEEIQN